jgi:hypothetical protein
MLQVVSMSSIVVQWHVPPGAPSVATSWRIVYRVADDISSKDSEVDFPGSQNSAVIDALSRNLSHSLFSYMSIISARAKYVVCGFC